MEDATITELEVFSTNGRCYSVFGVFDGHGGSEVSRFVANHFVEELKKNASFQQGDIAKALEQNFRRMDELLESSHTELNEIRKASNG